MVKEQDRGLGTSPVVQELGLYASNAGGTRSIPGQGNAMWAAKKLRKRGQEHQSTNMPALALGSTKERKINLHLGEVTFISSLLRVAKYIAKLIHANFFFTYNWIMTEIWLWNSREKWYYVTLFSLTEYLTVLQFNFFHQQCILDIFDLTAINGHLGYFQKHSSMNVLVWITFFTTIGENL